MEDAGILVAVAETQAEVVVTPVVGAVIQVEAVAIQAVVGGRKKKKKRRATRKSSG